jgi:hypothetical protein
MQSQSGVVDRQNMATKTNAASERKLKALERKYATPAEKYIAEFNQDKKDIESLVNDGTIDKGHAHILFEAAVIKRDEAAGKVLDRKLKEQEEAKALEPDPRSWWQRTFAI